MSEPLVSVQRQYTIWVGGLLLGAGHRVQIDPSDEAILLAQTKAKFRRLRIALRDTPLENPRAVIDTVAQLEESAPDAVVLGLPGNLASLRVVPVQSTRDSWIGHGRHYALPIEKLVSFTYLCQWLDKLGRPDISG